MHMLKKTPSMEEQPTSTKKTPGHTSNISNTSNRSVSLSDTDSQFDSFHSPLRSESPLHSDTDFTQQQPHSTALVKYVKTPTPPKHQQPSPVVIFNGNRNVKFNDEPPGVLEEGEVVTRPVRRSSDRTVLVKRAEMGFRYFSTFYVLYYGLVWSYHMEYYKYDIIRLPVRLVPFSTLFRILASFRHRFHTTTEPHSTALVKYVKTPTPPKQQLSPVVIFPNNRNVKFNDHVDHRQGGLEEGNREIVRGGVKRSSDRVVLVNGPRWDLDTQPQSTAPVKYAKTPTPSKQHHRVKFYVDHGGVEEGGFGQEGWEFRGTVRRSSYRTVMVKRAEMGFRVCEVVLCLIAFSVMAANKTQGWSGDSFDRYKEYRYCVAVTVIGFTFSVFQAWDLAYNLVTGKHMFSYHLRYHFVFAMDQILAYLLISASSSAATRVDNWVSNWGKDDFTEMATASISMSFLAFAAFAISSLISGCNLCNRSTS